MAFGRISGRTNQIWVSKNFDKKKIFANVCPMSLCLVKILLECTPLSSIGWESFLFRIFYLEGIYWTFWLTFSFSLPASKFRNFENRLSNIMMRTLLSVIIKRFLSNNLLINFLSALKVQVFDINALKDVTVMKWNLMRLIFYSL